MYLSLELFHLHLEANVTFLDCLTLRADAEEVVELLLFWADGWDVLRQSNSVDRQHRVGSDNVVDGETAAGESFTARRLKSHFFAGGPRAGLKLSLRQTTSVTGLYQSRFARAMLLVLRKDHSLLTTQLNLKRHHISLLAGIMRLGGGVFATHDGLIVLAHRATDIEEREAGLFFEASLL